MHGFAADECVVSSCVFVVIIICYVENIIIQEHVG
jgi:hypothetical protein